MAAAGLGYIASRAPEYVQVFDRLQFRERIDSALTAIEDLRRDGAVAAVLGLARRFGVANRALLGR